MAVGLPTGGSERAGVMLVVRPHSVSKMARFWTWDAPQGPGANRKLAFLRLFRQGASQPASPATLSVYFLGGIAGLIGLGFMSTQSFPQSDGLHVPGSIGTYGFV